MQDNYKTGLLLLLLFLFIFFSPGATTPTGGLYFTAL